VILSARSVAAGGDTAATWAWVQVPLERGSPSGDGYRPLSGKQLSFSPFQQGVSCPKAVWLLRSSDIGCSAPMGAAFPCLFLSEGGSGLSDPGTKSPLGEGREHLIMKQVQKSLWEDEQAAEWTHNPCNCIILISFFKIWPKGEFPSVPQRT